MNSFLVTLFLRRGKTNRYLCNLLVATLSLSAGSAYPAEPLGFVQANTNPALPNSYNFQEYVFPEPNDQGTCKNQNNSSAQIEEVFFAQTHRHSPDHPFYFLIGYRPALFQVAVTGSGASPNVTVDGFIDGTQIGSLCLKGPAELSADIKTATPDFSNYFSVTLPKSWVKPGLHLEVTAGNAVRTLTSAELKVGPYTELNLVMYELDVMDFNGSPHRRPVIKDFLQETASAIPVSVVRYGSFPERVFFPDIIATNETEQTVRLTRIADKEPTGVKDDGYINSITTLFMTNFHRSTGDYLSTVYFGNTLNLAPGGWGGGKSFVSMDFDDVYIHELGHALSLPHWGDAYEVSNPDVWQYLYPYGGENGNGGGRGESWNFVQHLYEFVNPICQFDARGQSGIESSDAMQRNNHCLEKRSDSAGPWDGFGDFSALAMHRYFVGGETLAGQVPYRNSNRDFQFGQKQGHPVATIEAGKRVYKRDALQPSALRWEESVKPVGDEALNQDVYLIYGTTHESQTQADILYKPIKFNGTLPPILDPTDITTFESLKSEDVYRSLLGSPRDITLRMTYADGSVLHALNPWHSFDRAEDSQGDFSRWRRDLSNFSLVVPGDRELLKVELFHRPLVVTSGNKKGNILDEQQKITANNFMADAVLKAEYDLTAQSPFQKVAANGIGNRVWHDFDRDGVQDAGEPGIAGVTLFLWSDPDDDGVPDYLGWQGTAVTDENGYYRFSGLSPGIYQVSVWSVDNWEEGRPLHGMVSSFASETDPNSDNNTDNNACFTLFDFQARACTPSMSLQDISSGIIELSAEGEPLRDGDEDQELWLYDPSGNMTIDFGFHFVDISLDEAAAKSAAMATDADLDGVPDNEDLFPLDDKESRDADSDGIGDNADPDDDNDGLTDAYETLHGLNANSASDASLDPDLDGRNNYEESLLGSDPNNFFSPSVPSSGAEAARSDFNGDGSADLLIRNTDGGWYLYTLQGNTVLNENNVSITRDLNWQPVSFSDFNGDGKSDILIRHKTLGLWWLYTMDGARILDSSKVLATRDLSWQPVSFGDTNADGKADILLRHTDGRWWRFGLSGATVIENSAIAATRDLTFEPVAFEDFNGDGTIDILVRSKTSGVWWQYLLDGAALIDSGAVSANRDQSWSPQSFEDFNGDGKADILIRNTANKSWWLYTLDGKKVTSSGGISAARDAKWHAVATQDFDGDGASDLLLRSEVGSWWLYSMSGNKIASQGRLAIIGNLDWRPVSFGDFNADGRADVMVRNVSTGGWWLYTVNGQQIVSSGAVKATGQLNWQPPR